MKSNKCKICRRVGEKLFLKGDKCVSPKCPFLKKPSPPGIVSRKRRYRISEYGRELKEAQKFKKMYGIQEKEFKRMVRGVLKKRGKEDISELLIKDIEKKLSNIIFRTGITKSRRGAKQLISHGHFLLNGKEINIPSIKIKKGDEIKLKEKSQKNSYFKSNIPFIKKENIPSWFTFEKEKFIIKVVREPEIKEAGMKIDIPLILSFYSR